MNLPPLLNYKKERIEEEGITLGEYLCQHLQGCLSYQHLLENFRSNLFQLPRKREQEKAISQVYVHSFKCMQI